MLLDKYKHVPLCFSMFSYVFLLSLPQGIKGIGCFRLRTSKQWQWGKRIWMKLKQMLVRAWKNANTIKYYVFKFRNVCLFAFKELYSVHKSYIIQYNQEYQEQCIDINWYGRWDSLISHEFQVGKNFRGKRIKQATKVTKIHFFSEPKKTWHPMTICKQHRCWSPGNSRDNEMLH